MSSTPRPSGSVTSNVSLLMFAKTIGFALNMALPLILARRLDQTQFGLYKQTFLVVATAIGVLPLGFGMSAYYFLPRHRDRESQCAAILNIVLFNFTAGGLACLALWLRPTLLELIFGNAGLVDYAPLIGVVIVLWISGSFLEIIPIAVGEVKRATVFIIAVQLTRTVVFVAAAVFAGTVRSLIYAAILQGVVQTCLVVGYLQWRFKGFWRSFNREMLRKQLSYALPLGFAGLLYTVQTDLHNYVVSNRFGPAMFAIYSIGTFNLPLIGLLQEAVTALLIPKVGLLQQEKQDREIIFLTARAMRKLAAIYFPIYAALIVTGPEFLSVLFTDRYRASWPIFAVNLTLLPLGILLQDPLFRAYYSQRYFLLRVRMVAFVALVFALLAGTSWFGPLGAVSAVVCITIVERSITITRFARLTGVKRTDIVLLKDVGKLALAASMAGVAATVTRALLWSGRPVTIVIACGVVCAIVYAASVLILGIITSEEKALVRQRFPRL